MKGRIYKAYKDSLEQKYPSFAQITEDQEFWHSDFWNIQNGIFVGFAVLIWS